MPTTMEHYSTIKKKWSHGIIRKLIEMDKCQAKLSQTLEDKSCIFFPMCGTN